MINKKVIIELLDKLFPPAHVRMVPKNTHSIADLLVDARTDWDVAETYFNSVADPVLVDQAIYRLAAAERQYDYLLRLARTQTEPGN